MCLWVCSLSPPRSFDGSLPNFVGVCRWTSHLPLRGSFSKKSTGRRVNGSLSLSTILYRRQPHTTQLQKAPFALVPQLQSLIRRLLLLHINGICRWTSQLLLRGSFSKRSMGQWVKRVTFTFTILYMIADDARLTPPRCKKHTGSIGRRVNGSTGQTGRRVTFTFTILYMIADDARLTPPCCKKHTAYHDTRLTPHRCKKHTASFACSTGKFPSTFKFSTSWIVWVCVVYQHLVSVRTFSVMYDHTLGSYTGELATMF